MTLIFQRYLKIIGSYQNKWAIANLKLDKSPGLDVVTGNFYKTFKNQVIPYLRDLFMYYIKVGRISDSWKEATLTLLKKDGKEEEYPGSYGPI